MTYRWLVTPYFFDDHDPALKAAVPANHAFHENDPGEVKDRSPRELARTHTPIAAFVAQSLRRNEIPVSVAGDCAASLPVMAGLQQSGLDPAEETALAMSQVNRGDLEALGGMNFDRPVYLHIDNDVIDAGEVPANNYPVAGGPDLRDVIEQCAGFAARNQICAISLSGWNGRLDGDGRTARACTELLRAITNA